MEVGWEEGNVNSKPNSREEADTEFNEYARDTINILRIFQSFYNKDGFFA